MNNLFGQLRNRSRLFLFMLLPTLIVILIIGSILARMIKVITTGSVGVVEFSGKIASEPLKPGIHRVNPWSNVAIYSTQMVDIKETIEATSREGLGFNVDVSLQYHINPDRVIELYQTIGRDEKEIVISRFRSTVRMITALYPVEAIYSTKRQELSDRLESRLKDELEPLGLTVDGVYVREVMLPDSFQAMIQNKLNEDQQNQQATFAIEQERQQMEFRLEQERQEAERKRIEAQGTADAQAILAQQDIPEILEIRSMEVIEQLAESPNAKIVILGNTGGNNVPLVLQALSTQGGLPAQQPQPQPQQ